MDRLAFEILDKIYTLACTDGGYTGCSLSLVSHSVRCASRTARFHSISLTSGLSRQLSQFLRCFSKERAVMDLYAPTVQHLCFAAAEGRKTPLAWRLPYEWREQGKSYGPKNAARIKPIVDQQIERYIVDIGILFQMVAKDLRTLCFIHSHGTLHVTTLRDIPCTGFPLLQELTLVGRNPFEFSGTPYPKLTHLHLGVPANTNLTPDDLDSWAQQTPEVTHLRLSNYGWGVPPGYDPEAGECHF